MVGTVQKKVTLSLDSRLVEEVRQLVEEGEARSQSAFFEAALRQRIAGIRRQKRQQALLAASRDPLFLADIAEVEQDFAQADAEASLMIR